MTQKEATTTRASIPGPETILRRELDNGIVVLAYENFSSPSVVLHGQVRAGSLAVPRRLAGLADFAADMLMRGTERRDFAAINESIESVGASLGFEASWHATSFTGRSLAEDLPLLLDVAADCLRHPIFPPDQVEKVRGEVLTAIEQRSHDTRRTAMLNFYETLYDGHPMGLSSLGYTDSISAITRDDLREFYESFFRPTGMVVVVVGAVRAEEAVAAVDRVLGDWRVETPAPVVEIPPLSRPGEVRRKEVALPGKTQADLVLGYIGPSRKDPDYQAARLANTILGVFGIYGRIGDSVRDRDGLAYYVYTTLVPSLTPAPWMAIAGVHPDNVERALEGILNEIRRLREEPIPPEELENNKSYLIGSLPIGLETNAGIATTLEAMEIYGLGLDYLQRYPAIIGGLTAEEVQAIAQKYLDPAAYTLSIAWPA